MIEWSDVDLAVRDAVRQFVDKEVRPHVDALESGDMEPYPIIRKLFSTFGIDAMSRESLDKRLARMRDGTAASGGAGASGGMFGGGSAQAGMGFVVISELCRVSMGIVTGLGVSLGLTVPTIAGRGTLAQQERWLPGLVTYEKIGAWAITEPDSGSDAFGGMKSYVVRAPTAQTTTSSTARRRSSPTDPTPTWSSCTPSWTRATPASTSATARC